MSATNKGDMSKSRRVLRQLDILLDLVRDETVFSNINYKEVEVLESHLIMARAATANIMATLGDSSEFISGYLQRRSKDNEHGTIDEEHNTGISEEGGDRGRIDQHGGGGRK